MPETSRESLHKRKKLSFEEIGSPITTALAKLSELQVIKDFEVNVVLPIASDLGCSPFLKALIPEDGKMSGLDVRMLCAQMFYAGRLSMTIDGLDGPCSTDEAYFANRDKQ